MEFVRRNYNSSSRQLINSSMSGSGGGNAHLPPTPSNRSGRGPSVARYTSVERETEPSIPPPYRSREPSVVRRSSRDYSSDRWSSTTASHYDNDYKTSNKRRSDRWSSIHPPNTSSSTYNFSSLPGRILPACPLMAWRQPSRSSWETFALVCCDLFSRTDLFTNQRKIDWTTFPF